jgi:hypothetical protein
MIALEGMARDPAQRLQFLDVNIFDPKYKLSEKDKDRIISLRNKLIRAPLDEPLVRSGWSAMRQQFGQQLKDLGVIHSTGKENYTEANKLRGNMVIAIEEFETANRRPPTKEEFTEKIAKPLITTHQEPSWFGLMHKDVAGYATPIDKKVLADAEKELAAAAEKQGISPPTENEISNYITHQRWKLLFQGASGRAE